METACAVHTRHCLLCGQDLKVQSRISLKAELVPTLSSFHSVSRAGLSMLRLPTAPCLPARWRGTVRPQRKAASWPTIPPCLTPRVLCGRHAPRQHTQPRPCRCSSQSGPASKQASKALWLNLCNGSTIPRRRLPASYNVQVQRGRLLLRMHAAQKLAISTRQILR